MRRCLQLLLALGLLAAGAASADETHSVRIRFERGASGATLHGTIAGGETILYRLATGAGQMLAVTLDSRHGGLEFNVFSPGKVPGRDEALFIGSTGGSHMEVRTAEAGDHTIQVYLVRAAARRGEHADFTLRVAVTGAAHAHPAPPTAARHHDATVAGTEFHATGTLPCARAGGQPMIACRFGVRRGPRQGDGDVTVFWPDGGSRVITFAHGTPAHYDESQADGDARMTVRRTTDLFHVRIGDQRFEIPEAVISGG
jgi:hypothetical protein